MRYIVSSILITVLVCFSVYEILSELPIDLTIGSSLLKEIIMQDTWISVKKKLPNFDVDVLLFVDQKHRTIGHRMDFDSEPDTIVWWLKESESYAINGDGKEWGRGECFDVSAWMDLPEPPKEDIFKEG